MRLAGCEGDGDGGCHCGGGFGGEDGLGGVFVDDLGDGLPDGLGDPVDYDTALVMLLLVVRMSAFGVKVVVAVGLGKGN